MPAAALAPSRPAAALLLLSLSAAALPAAAAEWYVRPRLAQQLSFDDNVGFNAGTKTDTYQSTTTPAVTLGARSPTLFLELDLRGEFQRLPEEPRLDANNQFVSLSSRYTGKRTTLGLDARFDRDTTRNDQFDESGERLLDNKRRQNYLVGPSLTYQLNARDRLQFDAGYRARIYPTLTDGRGDGLSEGVLSTEIVNPNAGLPGEPATLTFSDPDVLTGASPFQGFEQYTTNLTYIRQLSARTGVGGGFTYFYYDSNRQDVQEASPQLFLSRIVTPRLRFDARGGPSLIATRTRQARLREEDGTLPIVSRTVVEVEEEDDLSFGYLVNAGLEWNVTPRTDARVRYIRSLEPFGTGSAAVNRDTLRLNFDHDLSPTVRLFATFVGQLETATGNENQTGDRYLARFEPGVRWSAYPDVDVSLRYRFRYQRVDSSDGNSYRDTSSNAVFVRVEVQLPELRQSW